MSPSLSEVLGRQLRIRREQSGNRQEDVARVGRQLGLSWSRPRIVAIEAGTRQFRADEMLLLPGIISLLTGESVTLADLLAGEVVELAPGAIGTNLDQLFAAADVLPLVNVIHTDWARDEIPGLNEALNDASKVAFVPLDSERGRTALANGESWAVVGRIQQLVGTPLPFPRHELSAVGSRIDEADRKAAKATGEHLDVLVAVALAAWGQLLSEERDERLGDTTGQPARTIQARRGRITRELYTELREEIAKRESKQ